MSSGRPGKVFWHYLPDHITLSCKNSFSFKTGTCEAHCLHSVTCPSVTLCEQPHQRLQQRASHATLLPPTSRSALGWHARAQPSSAVTCSQWPSCMALFWKPMKRLCSPRHPLCGVQCGTVTKASFVSARSGFCMAPTQQQSLYSGWANKRKVGGLRD